MTEETTSVTIGDTPEAPNDDTPAEPFKAFATKEEYQIHLDHVTQERLEREKRKALSNEEEAKRQARENALKEQEDWKKLAHEHAETIESKNSRITELESIETERDSANERTQALEERLKGLIKPQLEAVPELYRPFVESMGVEEQAEWLSENAEKLGTQNGPGRPAGSRPTGKSQTVPKNETDKEARERQRQARVSAI